MKIYMVSETAVGITNDPRLAATMARYGFRRCTVAEYRQKRAELNRFNNQVTNEDLTSLHVSASADQFPLDIAG